MKRTAKTSALPAPMTLRTKLAIAAAALALLAIPHFAHAQGIVGGARDGSREGYRAAGPVGGIVGGAVGAGVGGAVGGVKGVLGIPDQGYDPNPGPRYRAGPSPRYRAGYRARCRGYRTRSGSFRCYR